MKKLLSLTLVILMLFSTVSINVLASTTPSDWAVNEVNNAKNAGIITSAVTKNYQKDITREEFCELVVKLYEKLTNKSAKAGTDIFTDTDNQEILKAYNLGIVKGVSSNQFAPYNNITRQEICVMLVRCIDVAIENADINDFNNNSFADNNKIADWAIDYVNYAYDNGIMKGVGNNCIDPLGNATCEQSVLLAYRIYSTYAQSDVAYEVEIENIETDQETDISYVNNIVIILFKNSATQEDKDEVVPAINGEVVGHFDTINQYQVQVKTSTLNELIDMCDTVNEFDCVLTATYDIATQVSTDAIITPNDKWNNDNWNEANPSGNNWWLEVIQAPSAWSYNDKLGNIKIGIVDNGFDTGHEDLKNELSFAAEYNKDINNKEDHGSHVAGIIGATANNNKGITGIVWNSELVCFDWQPSWLQSKLGGWSTSTFIAAGLIETVKSGSKVVNFSLGCTASMPNNNSRYSQEWIDAQGYNASMYMASLLSQGYDFVVVQSAGNGASDGIGVDAIYNGWFSSITRNNCYNNLNTVNDILDRIIIVGAAEQNNGTYRQARFSNGGNQVDICAPGVDIYSTITGGIAGKYGNMSGTSMAAPIVAGVVGLVWSADSDLTGAEVKDIVCDTDNSKITVADNANSRNAVGTYKMVNAKLSVENALGIESDNELDKLVGTYKGSYMQNQGETGLTLTVYEENGQYKAIFDFYNLPGKTNAKSGKYYMNVSYDKNTKDYIFKATEWIDRPSDYFLVDLRGKLEDGVLSGNSPTKFRITTIDKYISPSVKLNNLIGTYEGSYFAGQGETGLTLTIYEDDGQYKAIFDFYNLPGKTNAKSGSYYMNVSYDELYDTYSFEAYEWIDRPSSYDYINLKGTYNNGVLSGTSPTKFEIYRSR